MTLLFFAVLALLAWLAQQWSARRAAQTLTCRVHFSRRLADPDQPFQIVTVLENRSRWPLGFARVQVRLPREMEFPEAGPTAGRVRRDDWGTWLSTTLYMKPRQRLTRRLTASLPARGRYQLRDANVAVGDFLGLAEHLAPPCAGGEIVIAPRPAREAKLERMLGGLLGEVSARQFLLEDPILTVGAREYTGREPRKAISWMQTARTGRMMVKQYDHTRQPLVTVLLNTDTDLPAARRAELLEGCFSLARTVCETLEKQKVEYRFCTNATTGGPLGPWAEVESGLGTRHLEQILEGLGRADYGCTCPFADLAKKEAGRAELGRGYLVVTPPLDPGQKASLDRLCARTGCPISVLEGGRGE